MTASISTRNKFKTYFTIDGVMKIKILLVMVLVHEFIHILLVWMHNLVKEELTGIF